MRILFSTLIALVVSLIFFMIIKIWGQSQPHVLYKHPFFEKVDIPLKFKVLTPQLLKKSDFNQIAQNYEGFYLNVAMTEDQKLVLVDPNYEVSKPLKNNKPLKFQNIKLIDLIDQTDQSAIEFTTAFNSIKNKKIIFNFLDNPLQLIKVFETALNATGLQSGDQFIFVSGYEPPAKTLKEDHPAFLFGTTSPEILKLKAMESLFLIEAAVIRADVLIHPLTYYKKTFFTDTMIAEARRRQMKIIIGPEVEENLTQVINLKPDGVILH